MDNNDEIKDFIKDIGIPFHSPFNLIDFKKSKYK